MSVEEEETKLYSGDVFRAQSPFWGGHAIIGARCGSEIVSAHVFPNGKVDRVLFCLLKKRGLPCRVGLCTKYKYKPRHDTSSRAAAAICRMVKFDEQTAVSPETIMSLTLRIKQLHDSKVVDVDKYKTVRNETVELILGNRESLMTSVAANGKITFADYNTKKTIVKAKARMIAFVSGNWNHKTKQAHYLWQWAFALKDIHTKRIASKSFQEVAQQTIGVGQATVDKLLGLVKKPEFVLNQIEDNILRAWCMKLYGFDTIHETELGPDTRCVTLFGLTNIEYLQPSDRPLFDLDTAEDIRAMDRDRKQYERTGESKIAALTGLPYESHAMEMRNCGNKACPHLQGTAGQVQFCSHGDKCNYAACKDYVKLSKCGNCKQVEYCSRECQVTHWKIHKTVCKASTPKLVE